MRVGVEISMLYMKQLFHQVVGFCAEHRLCFSVPSFSMIHSYLLPSLQMYEGIDFTRISGGHKINISMYHPVTLCRAYSSGNLAYPGHTV